MKLLKKLTIPYQPLNVVQLNQQNLLHNLRLLQTLSQKKLIPVLKSNAYGHGIREIAQILNQFPCDFIATDSYFEANQIRKISQHRLLIMGYTQPSNIPLFKTNHRFSYVVQDLETLLAFAQLNQPVHLHLELNTGMNRLGLSLSELPYFLQEFKKHPQLHLEGVMSHLADADNPQNSCFVQKQQHSFEQALQIIQAAGFQPEVIHLAASAGSLKTANSPLITHIRPGIAIYGLNPLEPTDPFYSQLQPLKPVLELKSTIIKTLDLKKGDQVGYNCTFTASKPTRIAILPLGYYEALPRSLSNQGILAYQKQTLPFIGRICMNHAFIDISSTQLQVGDQITVFSAQPTDPNSILGLQKKFQLFPHEVLVHISNTIRREII